MNEFEFDWRTDGQCILGPAVLLDVVQGSVEYLSLDVVLVDGVVVFQLLGLPFVLLDCGRVIT